MYQRGLRLRGDGEPRRPTLPVMNTCPVAFWVQSSLGVSPIVTPLQRPNNALQLTAQPRSAFAERYCRRGAAPPRGSPRREPRITALRLRGALLAAGRQLNARAVGPTEQNPEPAREPAAQQRYEADRNIALRLRGALLTARRGPAARFPASGAAHNRAPPPRSATAGGAAAYCESRWPDATSPSPER